MPLKFRCRVCSKKVSYHLAQWLRWEDMTAICQGHEEARRARGTVPS